VGDAKKEMDVKMDVSGNNYAEKLNIGYRISDKPYR
jgi:hypothetical protein